MTTRLTKDGRKVSLLGYGAMRLPTVDGLNAAGRAGGKPIPGTSRADIDQKLLDSQVKYMLDQGVNYFDTSPAYCMGRPIDLSRPCQTLPASMGGNKTPIIDTRLLADPEADDWLVSLHSLVMAGKDLSKMKVPSFMRRLTVSEAAALQGFPDDFSFCGSQCEKFRQIGNSVPPPFANSIAKAVVSAFNRSRRHVS